ncbi:hypothetical protein [Leptolyngbya sp. NIES-2104]|nr:hypothetical protein [Leptolyngbya sp. NIES-2104]GAP94380.1 hypothetical protein NIES2104_08910 [Leptolyngbya sp. NIES-2104]
MLGKPRQFGSDRQTRSNPALWFFLQMKQSGFVWGLTMRAAEEA